VAEGVYHRASGEDVPALRAMPNEYNSDPENLKT
jgi:hypothetical protein